ACRTAVNWLRRNQRRLMLETPFPYRQHATIADLRQGPRGNLERGERFERVQLAIEALPERYRLPVVLRYLQELSYDEISVFTGESRDEIRGILQRAGQQLREALAGIESEEGTANWRPASK
ncbi:MAG: sigma-70 family RNA polymerase sigma factor, partial [Candidatus Hydrogenedentes bacterium]|nr:sigma-70 family RNA polymerase sigma factor [Candidatus Hydrogenedentota bacterium]